MNKQLKRPTSKRRGEQITDVRQRDFGILNQDDPASQLREIDLSDLRNAHAFPKYCEGRTGSILFSESRIPSITTGYTCRKIGDIIYRISGPSFLDEESIRLYFMWRQGHRDEIIQIIDANHCRARESGDIEEQTGYVCGAGYAAEFYTKTKENIFQYDSRFFSSNWHVASYNRIYPISVEDPEESPTKLFELEDNMFAINANGIFKIPMDVSARYFYKINSPSPTERITDVDESDVLTIGRRYVYGMARLVGDSYHGDRAGVKNNANVPVLAIEQESGMTLYDIEEGRDWGEVFTQLHRGLGNETYGVLTCATGGGTIEPNVGLWAAIANGTCLANFNATGNQTVWMDFTNYRGTGNAVTTLEQVREVIELAFRAIWPNVDVTIERDAANLQYFQITSGKKNGSTVSLLANAGIGTDISNLAGTVGLQGTVGAGAAIDNAAMYTEVSEQGSLVCATARGYAYNPQTHWTHFAVFGTENSNDPVKNEELYSWLFDVPIMAAFTVQQSAGNILTCADGEGRFRQYDISAVVTFQNGAQSTIQYLTDAAGNRVFTPTSRYALGTGGAVAEQSAQIGASHCLTIRQNDDIVTRISGTRVFAATDVRKPIFYADGTIDNIIEFIDEDHVRMLSSSDRPRQGAAMDPDADGRNFGDYITDEIVASRYRNNKCLTRFWEALPEVDTGCIVPGFLICGLKDETTVYYSPMKMGDYETRTYHTGYHNPDKHVDDKLKDKIRDIRQYPDTAVVYCSNSRWIADTANPISDYIADYGITNALLPNFVKQDNIGCNHIGSIAEVDIGEEIMVTSEPEVRIANNTKYGTTELSADQVLDTIRRLSTRVRGHYNPFSGYILWGALADSPVQNTAAAEQFEASGGYGEVGNYGDGTYKGDSSTEVLIRNNINRYTGICLRYAVTAKQGQGWSIYENGEYWLWPEPNVKILTILDGAEQPHYVVLDEPTGLWWEIGTRQGPSGSGMVPIYLDKQNDYGGAEIPGTVARKEQMGPREHIKIRHLVAHIGMRPMAENLRNTEGYNARGYRNAFQVSYGVYRDGELQRLYETNNVPLPGDITVDDAFVEAHRLREEIRTTTSAWRLVGLNPEYIIRDKKLPRSQGLMQEDQYDLELSTDMLFWISRQSEPLRDRISDTDCTGSYFARATGPDGLESAITIVSGDSLTHALRDITGDFAIKLGIRGEVPMWLVNIGDLQTRIDANNEFIYDDGQNFLRRALEWRSGWLILSIQRRKNDLLIYEQGALRDTIPIPYRANLSGDIEINPAATVDLFDVRVYPKAISAGAEAYYYRNVTLKQGKAVLPQWV